GKSAKKMLGKTSRKAWESAGERCGGGGLGRQKEGRRKEDKEAAGKSAKKMLGKTSRKAWESEEEKDAGKTKAKMRGNRGNGKEKAWESAGEPRRRQNEDAEMMKRRQGGSETKA
ncbi:hypothetical protein, partial [uncultured Alistipes sp.]|uniref:hypothetical protein n=2 Tax=uncultured Alistipes sp. TaxID=538949 RepID=UPI00265E36C0